MPTSHFVKQLAEAYQSDHFADIEITSEYQQVIDALARGAPAVFVTGGAGTGKSVLISHLRNTLRGNVVVLAPTGVAALNVGGATIHSFFRFPPRVLLPKDIEEPSNRRALYCAMNVLIIDEISMVRVDVLDAIDAFLRLNGRHHDRPFGGVQLVMVGDLFQLPPVVTPAERQVLEATYPDPFFFCAHALQAQEMQAQQLTKSFRQTDPAFVDLLNRLRFGRSLPGDFDTLKTRVAERPEDAIVLTPTNKAADDLNNAALDRLPGVPTVYEGRVTGRIGVEEDRLPSPMRLCLKPEARVMFTQNDAAKRWVNGSLGYVTELLPNGVMVRLNESQKTVEVTPSTWQTYRYELDTETGKIVPVVASIYMQIPLMPAWALTIHKSQGKTLAAVHVDLASGAFAAGQVYVALSRVRRLEDLTLTRPVWVGDIRVDPRVVRFHDSLLGQATDGTPKAKPAVPIADPYAETRALIDAAIQGAGLLKIAYIDRNGQTTERIISPEQWAMPCFVEAFCHLRNDKRTFALARITACTPIEVE